MSKLYFKYGVMGSSKTANALMCKFNYEQQGFNVIILKPDIDIRDIQNNQIIVKSRIGLSSPCIVFAKDDNLINLIQGLDTNKKVDVIIIDECQFLTEKQVEQLKQISINKNVLCYGLLTDFKTRLFEGSKRLIELADSIQELKSVCRCGRKAIINARFVNGKISTNGDVVAIEKGSVQYKPMCYNCYINELKK